jgi:hypothetical protein
VRADAAYEARRQRREAWLDQGSPRNERHLPEPGTIARAYVVTADPYASPQLTRAVSVAAESHLLTTPLRLWLAGEVGREAKRLRTAEEVSRLLNSARPAEREQQARRQAELHRELAYERPRHSLAAREAERAADREAEL